MDIEKMREEFEAWWKSEMNIQMMDLHRLNFPMQKADFIQPYACHDTQRSWLAWQASRESVVIELPPITHMESEGSDVLMNCAHAIHAAGVKTK
jgi:hypothetical protein